MEKNIFQEIGDSLAEPSVFNKMETWMKLMLVSNFALVGATLLSNFIGKK